MRIGGNAGGASEVPLGHHHPERARPRSLHEIESFTASSRLHEELGELVVELVEPRRKARSLRRREPEPPAPALDESDGLPPERLGLFRVSRRPRHSAQSDEALRRHVSLRCRRPPDLEGAPVPLFGCAERSFRSIDLPELVEARRDEEALGSDPVLDLESTLEKRARLAKLALAPRDGGEIVQARGQVQVVVRKTFADGERFPVILLRRARDLPRGWPGSRDY